MKTRFYDDLLHTCIAVGTSPSRDVIGSVYETISAVAKGHITSADPVSMV